MKSNILTIQKDKVEDLKAKFESLGLRSINYSEFGQWKAFSYFPKDIEPKPIPWFEEYEEFFC